MKISQKQKLWSVVKLATAILVLFLVLQWLLPALSSPEFKEFVEGLGVFGPLVIILYIIVSHVIAPLAGTPGVLLGMALFGIYQTVFYIYLAGLISATINFWLSRLFGRRWIVKLVGKKIVGEVDKFVVSSGTAILILSRLCGFTLFEVVSYAFGLTEITFKKYFLITLVFSAMPAVIFAYFFRNTNFDSARGLLLWLGSIIVFGVIFSFLIKKLIKKKKNV